MSQDRVYNVLIVGVGGQGIILASDVLGKVAAKHGYDVKKNEIHGMAQRGGSVSSHVRFGKTVRSPIIKIGEADILLSFEQIETLRYFPFLSEKDKSSLIIRKSYLRRYSPVNRNTRRMFWNESRQKLLAPLLLMGSL